MIQHHLQMVLYCPQIPPNTGCIARTCAATNTVLHLVKPIGFDISEKAVKRAGLDYWHLVKLQTHESWQDFLIYKSTQPGRLLAFSPAGLVNYQKFVNFTDDWIVHGRESDGLPKEIMKQCDFILHIPMFNPGVRSLNLAVSASLSIFEAISQISNKISN